MDDRQFGLDVIANKPSDVPADADQAEKHANVLILLDLSGSMAGRKLEKAVEALKETVLHVPADVSVGLRLLGEDEPSLKECQNTRLVVPLGHNKSLEIDNVLDRIQGEPSLYGAAAYPTNSLRMGAGNPYQFQSPGKNLYGGGRQLSESINLGPRTPIGRALKDAWAKDFLGKDGPKSIILITDGEENCGDDPCKEIRKINADGAHLRVNIISLDGADDNKLKCISENANGQIVHMDDLSKLQDQLDLTFKKSLEGQVLDPKPPQPEDGSGKGEDKPNCHCHNTTIKDTGDQ